jgi:hypothetical protein
MKAPLYFRYVGTSMDNETEIPLEDLGRSLLGFNKVIKDFTKIAGLNGEIEVRATSYKNGSLIFDTILELNLQVGQMPFEQIGTLLDFLKLVSIETWREAVSFFNEIKQDGFNQINDYFVKRPFDLAIFATLIPLLLQWIKNRKTRIPIEDKELSYRISKELQSLIDKGIFSDALRPLIEDSATSIEVSDNDCFENSSARIDSGDLGDYLAPEEQILPELRDGMEYTLKGEITSLKATRGDSLTFHYLDGGKPYNLDAMPDEGKSTKDYVTFYKEHVNLTAQVERNSYFKKPKLHIRYIDLVQPTIDF